MTENEPRPEVVDAVYSALINMDQSKLLPLQEGGTRITASEKAAAEDLYLASRLASLDHRTRWLRAMEVLIGGRKFTTEPTWAELFDGLSPEGASELRDFYDAFPDGARAEYDRRYGPSDG
jgi:hypothetical protein